jgi:hypothetical protein
MGRKRNVAPVTAMCFGFLCTILLTPATAPATKRANSPGWAVWAYRTNPNPPYIPQGWHPCYIQYVASEYPHQRYTERNGYVRVRFANSQRDADHYISMFSMYHDDKTDNVIKFYTCAKVKFATQYANTAVAQNKQNLSRRCGFTGRAWQNNFINHFSWALGRKNSDAEWETKSRDRALKKCK